MLNTTPTTRASTATESESKATPGIFRVNRARAVEACAQATVCLRKGDYQRAEELSIDALRSRPSCHLAYQVLGRIFEKQGSVELADSCFRGRLPSRLIHHYFEKVPEPGSVSKRYRRTQVFPVQRIPLPRPGCLFDQQKAAFKKREIAASACFFDTLTNGCVWHDSRNTLVLDAAGEQVAEHTSGDATLLHTLRQQYKPRHLNGRVVLLGGRGAHNYYHWIADIIPKLGVLAEGGFTLQADDVILVSQASAKFARDLLSRAGIDEKQIVQSESLTPYITADELIIPHLSNTMGYTMGSWLPRFMQETILGYPSVGTSTQRKLYISRDASTAAGRTIENQQSVENLFTQYDFEIIRPEQYDVVEQAQLFSEAMVVAAPHGAGLGNLVYCAPGTRVIEFYGAHIAPCYWAISALAQLQYFNHCCVVSESSADAGARRKADYSIPLDAAEELLHMAGCS